MHEAVRHYIDMVRERVSKRGGCSEQLCRLIWFLGEIARTSGDPKHFEAVLRMMFPGHGDEMSLYMAWAEAELGRTQYGYIGSSYDIIWEHDEADLTRWRPSFRKRSRPKITEDNRIDGSMERARENMRRDMYGPSPESLVQSEEEYYRTLLVWDPNGGVLEGAEREAYIEGLKRRRAEREWWIAYANRQFSEGNPVVRRDVIPATPNPGDRSFQPLWSRAELEPAASEIPGARNDWAPSRVVTYEPDLGEDLELSPEEERAWRGKR